MNKINNRLIDIFNIISRGLAFIFLAILVTFLLFGSVHIQINEKTEFIFWKFWWVFFLFGHLIAILLIRKNYRKINEKLFFLIFSAIYLLIGMYIIYFLSFRIRADAWITYTAGNEIRNGDFSRFAKTEYLGYYPHQHGMVYYSYLLTNIIETSKILFSANMLEIIGINYFIYKITDTLFDSDKLKNLLAIYLSFAFVQQLIFITFPYNLIPGFLFMIIGLYFVIKFNQNKGYNNLIFAIPFLIISCFIRSNYIIVVIAIFIYIWITNVNKLNSLKFLIAFLIFNQIFSFSTKKFTENLTDYEVSSGAPKILWIAMGTDPENWRIGPGWYNGFNKTVMEETDYDFDKAGKIGKEKLIENLRYYISNPKSAGKFFGIKFLTTWAEPTYESVWSGPHIKYEQENNSKILNSLFNEGNIYWVMYNYMKSIQFLIYALSLYYLFNKKIYNKNISIFFIYFLGGVVFHLIWETKSQYVYPYVILLIPIVCESLGYVFKKKKI